MRIMNTRVLLPLLVLSLTLILLAGVIPATASDQYTAKYLLDLYQKARAELIDLLAQYEGSIDVQTTTTTTTSSSGSESETTTASTVTGTITATTTSSTTSLTTTTDTETNATSGLCARISDEVNLLISQADQLAEAANSNLESGNYKLAANLALKALNTIGKAYVHLAICMNANTSISTGGTTTGTETETTEFSTPRKIPPGLLSTILRHEIRLNRLRAAIEAAGNSGVDVSAESEMADEVESLLSQSRELLLSGNVSGAVSLMTQANRLMSKIVRSLKTSSVEALEHRKSHGRKTITANTPEMTTGTERGQGRGKGMGKGHDGSDHTRTIPPGHEKKSGNNGRGKGHNKNTGGSTTG